MRVIRTAEFEKSLGKLTANIRRLFFVQEERLTADWRDSRLHLKKLNLPEAIYSFRVTRSYRALFYFSETGEIVLFDIDDRKDIYR